MCTFKTLQYRISLKVKAPFRIAFCFHISSMFSSKKCCLFCLFGRAVEVYNLKITYKEKRCIIENTCVKDGTCQSPIGIVFFLFLELLRSCGQGYRNNSPIYSIIIFGQRKSTLIKYVFMGVAPNPYAYNRALLLFNHIITG